MAGPTVDLEISDTEDAGIREVLQTPGAYGAWSILDALLAPTGAGTPFVFKEPLGQAREVNRQRAMFISTRANMRTSSGVTTQSCASSFVTASAPCWGTDL